MIRSGLSIIGMALVLSGARAAGPTDEGLSSLFGSNGLSFWNLTYSANGPQDPDAVFHFERQSLSLDVPCYRRSWAYRYAADSMTFTTPWGSQSRCNGDVPPIVASFDSTLPDVRTPRVDGDKLSLLDANDRPLYVLTRLTATGLENRKWQISAFFDGRSLVTTRGKFAPPLTSHVTFMHGSLTGSPGCGGFFGGYALHGQQATIGAVDILGGWCPPGEFELGGTVTAALNGVRAVEEDGERIVLRDIQGRIQIVLTPWEQREF